MAFMQLASTMAEQVPQDHGQLAEQLRRAALAIPLIMAGAGGQATARGAALACKAIVDVLEGFRLVVADQAKQARELLACIAAKLSPEPG